MNFRQYNNQETQPSKDLFPVSVKSKTSDENIATIAAKAKTTIEKLELGIDNVKRMNKEAAAYERIQNRDWSWYQENAPEQLDEMSKNNPSAFAQLYKNEYGVYPDKYKAQTTSPIASVTIDTNTSKTWSWYQENVPEQLDEMSKNNPSAFAQLYKDEYGVYPDNK